MKMQPSVANISFSIVSWRHLRKQLFSLHHYLHTAGSNMQTTCLCSNHMEMSSCRTSINTSISSTTKFNSPWRQKMQCFLFFLCRILLEARRQTTPKDIQKNYKYWHISSQNLRSSSYTREVHYSYTNQEGLSDQ